MKVYKLLLTISISLIFIFTACEDRSDLTAPGNPNTGSANFTSFVAIGNSLTAGYQGSSLYESAQEYSFSNLIAQQVGTEFVQPLVSEPGIPGKFQVTSIELDENGEIANVNFAAAEGLGSPMNPNYAAPYNNLGVPGAILYDITDTTDFISKSASRENPYFAMILRSQQFGNSILAQALAQNPTFITMWIGNNDVLGYAVSGGTEGTDQTGTQPTDPNVFAFLYDQITTGLLSSGAKIAVANIPDVKSIPFATTVGPRIAQGIQAVQQVNPQVQGLVYFMGDNMTPNVATVNNLIDLNVLVILPGGEFASYIGQPFNFYDAVGVATPPNVDPSQPFGVTPQNPWPNALILDAVELDLISQRTNEFNNTISGIVTAHSDEMVLIDIHSVFSDIAAKTQAGDVYLYDGIPFTAKFIEGGLFSLDGVHPTNQGQGIVANLFIQAINNKWGASIPMVDVGALPGSLPLKKQSNLNKNWMPKFPYGLLDNVSYH